MVAAEKYADAAALQAKLNDLKVSLNDTAGTTPIPGTPTVSGDKSVTIKGVCETQIWQYKHVRLGQVRMLSIGKPEQSKGTCKSTGKAHGKGKGKGANKAAGKQSVQLSQVVYFGDEEGYIVCTLASGDDVQRVPHASRLNALATVSALKPRTGNNGVLYWTERTMVRFQLELSLIHI